MNIQNVFKKKNERYLMAESIYEKIREKGKRVEGLKNDHIGVYEYHAEHEDHTHLLSAGRTQKVTTVFLVFDKEIYLVFRPHTGLDMVELGKYSDDLLDVENVLEQLERIAAMPPAEGEYKGHNVHESGDSKVEIDTEELELEGGGSIVVDFEEQSVSIVEKKGDESD